MARLAIRMPKMSMTMTEGEVATWFAKVGDTVAEGDVVCEVMTDKVDMEVESSVSGTLVEIAVESGLVDVGEPIGWVEGEDTGGGFGDLLSEPAPEAAPPDEEAPADVLPVEESEPEAAPDPAPDPEPEPDPAPAPEPEPEPEPDQPTAETASPAPSGPVAAVPRARGLARERGLDLSTLTGSGPDGLILLADVETAAPRQRPAPAEPAAASVASRPAPADRSSGRSSDRRAAIRNAVARKMTPSALVPQFTVWREIHLDAADAQRRGLSWTTVLLRAYAAALREVPELLSRWEETGPSEAGPPAVALAVATDRGLLVPTFVEPDLGPAGDVDAEIRAVVRSAHTGRLDQAYMGLANGSLSNLGGMGVDRFQALLTPPQGSVLSLGSIQPRPVAVPGGVGLALTVQVGLTVDHRIADGAHAATLLERFARRLGGSL